MMSKPQKVKKRCVSMPSPRAAFASTRPGYAMSSEPFEQMMQSLRPPSSSSVSNCGIGAGFNSVVVISVPPAVRASGG